MWPSHVQILKLLDVWGLLPSSSHACRDLVLGAVRAPQRVLGSDAGGLLAVREFEAGKSLVVFYRELANDGFVITAFWMRRAAAVNRKEQLRPKSAVPRRVLK